MRASERIIQDVRELQRQSPLLDLTNPQVFIKNLVWLYQIMSASENLMVVAAKESSGRLKRYLHEHLSEEADHAKWLAEDLATVGVSAPAQPLMRSAVELAGTQYYLIHHVSPACLLGYMAVLEGFPFPVSVCDELEQLYGKSLLRCLRYHAENDLEHRKELFRVIDEVDNPLVYQNAIRTQYLINEAFRADH